MLKKGAKEIKQGPDAYSELDSSLSSISSNVPRAVCSAFAVIIGEEEVRNVESARELSATSPLSVCNTATVTGAVNGDFVIDSSDNVGDDGTVEEDGSVTEAYGRSEAGTGVEVGVIIMRVLTEWWNRIPSLG